MSDKSNQSRIEYVIVDDILRILPNGDRVSVCHHNADTLGGFTTLELAVSARSQMYDYFSQCGIPLQGGDLEITPRLTSITVRVSEKDTTSEINVWSGGIKSPLGAS